MATIHFICGFMGFGKTTFSKRFAQEKKAKHFAIDAVIVERYGRDPQNFEEVYQKADDYIWAETKKCIQSGQDVILDYGFWNPEIREKAKEKALKLTDSIVWHQLVCEMDIAKNRVLKRTSENPQELYIDENCFYDRLKRYHPIIESEQLNVQYHYTGDCSKYKKYQ